jgi:xanthosine utilization system XapX-like protein
MKRSIVVTFRSIIKVSERFLIDNSPSILSGVAVTGTLTTAYLAVKGAFKASKIIEQEQIKLNMFEREQGRELTTKEKIFHTWHCYIPPAIAVVGTVGCIVGAGHINAKRMAALAAAYKISENQFGEYKDKVREIIGDKKDDEIRAEVAQDRVNANPPGERVSTAFGGESLCLDKWTDRYFRSDMQTIRAAENDVNKAMYRGHDVATLADFYEAIGLSAPKCANEVGWNSDAPLELRFDSVLTPEGEPVLVMDFVSTPFPIAAYFGQP